MERSTGVSARLVRVFCKATDTREIARSCDHTAIRDIRTWLRPPVGMITISGRKTDPMYLSMAVGTEGDEVFFHIAGGVTPEFLVMYMQALQAAAVLAAPVVSHQHQSVEFCVSFRIETHPRTLGADGLHERGPFTLVRKASR